jgi:tetratricopeptide (TPR) repeat protein
VLADGTSASAWPLLERMLDGYAGGWRAMYGQTCADSYGKRVQADQVFDLRLECLEARRAALDAFVAALGGATSQQLVRAPSAILPEIADCGIAGRLATSPLPSDREARAQIADIQKLVARAQAEQNLGDYRQAEASATRAVAAARKQGYQPLLAGTLVRLASIETDSGGPGDGHEPGGLDRAAQLFEEAYAAAERGRDDRQRLAAARKLVYLHSQRHRFAEAERWAGLAEGLLVRIGNPPADGAMFAQNIGDLRKFEARREESTAAFKRALDLARKIVPPNLRQVAFAEVAICSVIEDVAERIPCARRALETARRALGPEHPELAADYSITADALVLRKDSHAEG